MPDTSGVSDKGAAVEARNIVKAFGSGPNAMRALDNVSVAIRENEFFTLLGPSGCGKTTLLRLIAGFDYPTEGAILLYGEDIAALPPFKRPVNTVFQSYALFPHMTVGRRTSLSGWRCSAGRRPRLRRASTRC
jgi:spermidine/putrescine transport system ATP-binding protein